jgi:hypothetical protein
LARIGGIIHRAAQSHSWASKARGHQTGSRTQQSGAKSGGKRRRCKRTGTPSDSPGTWSKPARIASRTMAGQPRRHHESANINREDDLLNAVR